MARIKQTVSICLAPEVLAKVDEMADSVGLSRSSWLSAAVITLLKNNNIEVLGNVKEAKHS